jgi:hypothetical protein
MSAVAALAAALTAMRDQSQAASDLGALGGTRTPNLLIRSYWRAPARRIEIQRGPHVGGGRRQ